MKTVNLLIFGMLSLFVIIGVVPLVSAHCPLCTAGAAVGIGVARFYGVNDSIVVLFLGLLYGLALCSTPPIDITPVYPYQ